MKPFARIALRFFLGIETFAFAWSYFFGLHGLPAVIQMRSENQKYAQRNEYLQQEIMQLERSIEEFDAYAFYKEKYAREQLHMVRPDEIIYYRS